jgi:hypothetical protein
VYDTNVGDIAPISSYFNPDRWTAFDLNHKFGAQTQGSGEGSLCGSGSDTASTASTIDTFDPKLNGIKPRLLIYPEKSTSPTPTFSSSSSVAGDAELRVDTPVQMIQPVSLSAAETSMDVCFPPVELFTTLRLVFDEEVSELMMAPWSSFSSVPLNTVCYADKDPIENLLWW